MVCVPDSSRVTVSLISSRAVSMILCHDKPKGRARQIEKLAEVASRLRMLNNYSSLRAIITAINQSTFPGDMVMEIFRMRSDLYKKFLSSDVLLRTSGKHRACISPQPILSSFFFRCPSVISDGFEEYKRSLYTVLVRPEASAHDYMPLMTS